MQYDIKAIPTHVVGRLHTYRFNSNLQITEPKKKQSKRSDKTGQVFGRLTAVESLGVAARGNRWWGCECSCGEKVVVNSRDLRREHASSCGCLNREKRKLRGGQNRLRFGEASSNELLYTYIKSAQGRGHSWELSRDDFLRIVIDECHYCGVRQDRIRKPNKGVNGEFRYTGIDRINNNLGYTVTNVTACCWDCNRAKGTLTIAEFTRWIERLRSHAEKGRISK